MHFFIFYLIFVHQDGVLLVTGGAYGAAKSDNQRQCYKPTSRSSVKIQN